jgi:ABC-type bacteriocin/lantibiotic exporter with double-glycine peptidase domain
MAAALLAGGAPLVLRHVTHLFSTNRPRTLAGGVLLGQDGVVRQRNDRDCGIAALVMLLNRRGIMVSYDSVAATLPSDTLSSRGLSFQTLADLSQRHGLPLSGFKLRSLTQLHGNPPWLVRLGEGYTGHYAVVEQATPESIVLLDPGVGRVAYSRARFDELWSGYVLIPD